MWGFAKGVEEDTWKQNNSDLIKVSRGDEVDLVDVDVVRESLNGFWISADNKGGKEMLWLDFNQEKNVMEWKTIPYTEEIKRTKNLPLTSCPTMVELINLNSEVQLNFVGLVGSDTTKIERLTKTEFNLNGITYLRYVGYDFLKK